MTGGRGFRRRLAALGLGIALSAIVLTIVEAAFYVLNRTRSNDTSMTEPYLFAFSESMGYTSLPNAEGRAVKTYRGETIFDVAYRTDEFGRRVTPPSQCDTPPTEFIAFMGCSFTFGHGLDENETLPAFAQERIASARAYNYGFAGYGPQQALVKAESGTLRNEIAESNGTMVYVFMEHHVQRAIGSMRVWTQWGRHFPYYAIGDDGRLTHRGTFAQGRPIVSRVYDALKREQVMRYFETDLPLRIRESHLRVTAEVVRATRDAFLREYPEGRFVALIYPASPTSRINRESFFAMLHESGVETLNCSTLIDMSDPKFHLAHDGHPTAAANRAVADALASFLRDRDERE